MSVDGAHPVAHGFVGRVLKCFAAAGDFDDVCADEAHAEDVEGLAADVLGAHKDVAFQAEEGGCRGGGDAVLAGAGFGDDALFAHAEGEQGLADGVVDLVGAGVVEVFAFEVDCGAFEVLGEAAGEIESRGAADEIAEVVVEIFLEFGVGFGAGVFGFELSERGDEGFGDEDAAVGAEMASGVGEGGGSRDHRW